MKAGRGAARGEGGGGGGVVVALCVCGCGGRGLLDFALGDDLEVGVLGVWEGKGLGAAQELVDVAVGGEETKIGGVENLPLGDGGLESLSGVSGESALLTAVGGQLGVVGVGKEGAGGAPSRRRGRVEGKRVRGASLRRSRRRR